MIIKNETDVIVEVCVNQWGTGGDTDFSPIEPDAIETWNRSDKRGFVMVLKAERRQPVTFYVQANSEIRITYDLIFDHGRPIHPIDTFY